LYLGRGVFVCEVDGPDSGAGAEVENLLEGFCYGCFEEIAPEDEFKDMV
jgi:hypothetical protein